MDTTMEALIRQSSPEVYNDGAERKLRGTRLGQLLTADWKTNLLLAGVAYNITVGTLTAGADLAFITGGGGETTPNSDQPELICGPDTGYMIPLDVKCTAIVDLDANAEFGEIALFADRTQAPPSSVTGTILTPVNLLDGASAPGQGFRAFTATADITDPVLSELLDVDYVEAREFVSNGSATNLTNGIAYRLKMHYEPTVPSILAGPCSLVLMAGGTAAVTLVAVAKVAIVPATWFS